MSDLEIIKLSEMEPDDIYGILEIERDSFENPITEDEFARFATDKKYAKTSILTIHSEGVLAGYVIYERNQGYWNLIRIAVHNRLRRDGIGHNTMWQLCQRAASSGKRSIRAMVDEHMVTAQVFLRECGFSWKKTLHEDGQCVYLMEWVV